MTFVSVVAAVRNGAGFIDGFIGACAAVLQEHYRDFELILVDDASTDDTVARVDALLTVCPCVRLIRLTRSFGIDVALTAGLDSAIGDVVVVMQADRDPPAEIPALVALVGQGYGVVTGVASGGEPAGRRLLRWGFWLYCNRLLGLSYPWRATRLQALSRAAASAVTRMRSKRRPFPVLASQVGYRSTTHAYHQQPPAAWSLRDGLDRGLSIMVLGSVVPLRFVSYLGLGAALLNVVYAGYVVAVNLLKEHVAAGWTTLSLQMAGMFFFLFLILVVVCEYVGHILDETQDRPLYHVLEERNSSVLRLVDGRNVTDRSA